MVKWCNEHGIAQQALVEVFAAVDVQRLDVPAHDEKEREKCVLGAPIWVEVGGDDSADGAIEGPRGSFSMYRQCLPYDIDELWQLCGV